MTLGKGLEDGVAGGIQGIDQLLDLHMTNILHYIVDTFHSHRHMFPLDKLLYIVHHLKLDDWIYILYID